ncbi:hypothetical protein [Belnapia rosea]|uniref:Sel1 repeat family protein n=1 Tax=Belnapia rosea TaxID=938405 RepID=A0A1G6NS34_9PROT|nr:hypothetical protein [Belnapia rosea]SDC70538.1 hypothetical protein SAMN04487779_1002123 [Belnapia rosea]
MTAEELLRAAQAGVPPPGLPGPLRALVEDARGDWEAAHAAAQAGDDAASAWVHAYLHRKEGDLGNAGYWYNRAGRVKPAGTLEEEWLAIARALLDQPG